jgi:hypothetical protein
MRLIVKGFSGCLLGIAILGALIFVALLFLQGGVWLGEKVLPWLIPSTFMLSTKAAAFRPKLNRG